MTPRTRTPRPAKVPAELRVEMVPIDDVRPLRRNPRVGDVDRVRASIRRWGQYVPIIVRAETGEIVKGNHTHAALKAEGADVVAIVRRSISSDAEAEALAIADNVASDEATWNVGLLSEILKGDGIEIDATLLDPVRIGEIHVEAAAIAAADAGRALGNLADVDTPPTPARPTTRKGDVIRLVCGDSSDAAVVQTAVDAIGAPVDLVFTSPPYNVRVDYGDETSDETKPWPEYRAMLEAVVGAWLPHLAAGRMLCWNIGSTASVHPHRQSVMLEELGLTYVRELVWKKVGVPLPKWHVTTRAPVARRFTPNPIHELVYVFSKGPIALGPPLDAIDETAQHDVFSVSQAAATRDVPDDETGGRTGAKQSQGLKTRSRKKHPAPFPAQLVAPFAVHLTAPGEVIADPFAGAGTVALVAEQRERRAVMAEIDPGFCDVAIERWETLTGRKATRPRRRRRKKETTR